MDDDQIPVTPPDDVDDVDLYEDLDLFCSTRAVTECSLSYTEVSGSEIRILVSKTPYNLLYSCKKN